MLERGKIGHFQITLVLARTSMSAERPLLGLECGAHKILRSASSEIAFRPQIHTSVPGCSLRYLLNGIREATGQNATLFERQTSRRTARGRQLRKGDWKPQRSHQDGSFRRFPMPCVPRFL